MKKLLVAVVLMLMAFAVQASPVLYGCQSNNHRNLYFVIESGEFMVFDHNGMWLNSGQLDVWTDDGKSYYAAKVGDVVMGWKKIDSRTWLLLIIADNGNSVTEFRCR